MDRPQTKGRKGRKADNSPTPVASPEGDSDPRVLRAVRDAEEAAEALVQELDARLSGSLAASAKRVTKVEESVQVIKDL